MVSPIRSFQQDLLNVEIYEYDLLMGQAASKFVARKLNKAIQQKGEANLILATGASQFRFLEHFREDRSVDWSKITVFHLDEYYGLPDTHPASFRKYLRERILDLVRPKTVYLIEGDAGNIEQEVARYQALLEGYPIDVACIGIGENGHIAFNDPPVADFNDPKLIKIVELDERSRKQQLGEGWFNSLDEVPRQALSLTIPAMMNANTISCFVPDKRKANAVKETIHAPISTQCPASILRKHGDTTLFLDSGSASLI